MKRLHLISACVIALVIIAVGLLWIYERWVFRDAETWIDEHYAAVGRGELDRAMSHYSPEFFQMPKANLLGFRASLARLGTPQQRSLYCRHAQLRRGVRGLGFYLDLGYQTSYGTNGHFQENFELVRRKGNGGFLITQHCYD